MAVPLGSHKHKCCLKEWVFNPHLKGFSSTFHTFTYNYKTYKETGKHEQNKKAESDKDFKIQIIDKAYKISMLTK